MAEKILIVDDDLDSLKLIGLMLQRHGYEVIAASAGKPALAKARSTHPDLVILDIMMNDMDGYEVCRRLRADVATQDTPILMFTAKTMIDDKVAGFEAGADDYLTKPTHPAELASRVKAILARNAEPNPEQSGQRLSIGVIGVKGGVGTTTLAINLSAALMERGEQPILVDFNLGGGSMGLYLGKGNTPGIASILSKAPEERNQQEIESQMVTHETGLRALLASSRPKEALLAYTGASAIQLVEDLKPLGNPVILDLGSRLSTTINQLVRTLDHVIVVIEPDRISLQLARELTQTLESSGISNNQIHVVVTNRVQTDMQTPWQEIEQTIGLEIRAIISPDQELAYQAIEAGTPIVLFQPTSVPASQLTKLADDFRRVIGISAD